MNYKNLQILNKQAAEKAFSSNDVKSICEALVFVALNDTDWRWVQNKCLEFLGHESSDIRGLAATCLGHVARIHRQLDKEQVLITLCEHLDDSTISGRVADALDDIDMFLP